MNRRNFITAASTMAAATAWAPASRAQTRAPFDPRPGQWRTFEVTTRVEIGRTGAGETRVWVPLPSVDDVYQQTLDNQWSGNAGTMQVVSDGRYGASMLFARFDPSVSRPTVEVTSRFRAQSRKQDWSARRAARTDDARFWTAPTELMPVDGIVRRTAQDITRGRRTDVDKTRALYEWVVANTYREPKVPGCGVGDIKSMLETGNLGGKCGDINALFVGLNRAVGIPARDVYGIRVAPCAFGYKELGAGSATITRAQHCRAEVFLRDHGWVAMDPADVGKVMRLETADWIKDSGHPVVAPVKTALFGGWEGNWLGYNVAHDVALPHSKGPKVGFLMYPQAENDKGRFDPLDPDTFRYTITTRELQTA
ncbi:MAG TPA: transglutaminase domain-containing protein [Burkholderiaceae bacterium]|nr:transglutaminase domain-containing protein [Burkholderiaceae bacterium]